MVIFHFDFRRQEVKVDIELKLLVYQAWGASCYFNTLHFKAFLIIYNALQEYLKHKHI